MVLKYINSYERPVILDIGGGRECIFAPYKPPGARIISLDISPEQLALNRDADEILLADANKEIPLPEASVDLLISRTVMEHLESPRSFLQHSYRVLKPGGYCIHMFPCKFAPFAIINLILPQSLSRKILFYFRPESQGHGGFPAYYNKCYYKAMNRLLTESGFHVKQIIHYHYQSNYFDFFLPLFMLSAIYEIITLKIKNLASYLLLVSQKP